MWNSWITVADIGKRAHTAVEELITDGNIRFIVKEFPAAVLGEASEMASAFVVGSETTVLGMRLYDA